VSSLNLARITRRREVKAMQTTEKDPSERGKPIGDVPASDAATKPHIGPLANARKTESADVISNEKRLSALPVPAGKKAICVLCSEPSDEMFCGACVDKIRADAVEHKRWEERGKL
jgi:hypothetical protein